jgi:hypothetical protein
MTTRLDAAMTNPPKKQRNREIELAPDAWERFESAIKVVAKSPPLHKTKEGNPKRPNQRIKKRRPE